MCHELQIVVLLLFLRVSVYSISSRWLSSSSLTHKILDFKDSFDLKNLEKYLIAGHLVIWELWLAVVIKQFLGVDIHDSIFSAQRKLSIRYETHKSPWDL